MSVADLISAATNITVALAAIAALFFARQQVRASREISALEAYEDYHKFAIEYPQFCTGPNPKNLNDREVFRYIYFVLYILMVAERIFITVPKRESWIPSIEEDIRIHKKLISSEQFSPYLQQEWAISYLISKVLAE